MNENFLSDLSKLERIVSLSLDMDAKQKGEVLDRINALKSKSGIDISELIDRLTNINISTYNAIFDKKADKLTKSNIVNYVVLMLNLKGSRTIDNTLAFLENFNANIHKRSSYLQRIQGLKEKKGLIGVRQRSCVVPKKNGFEKRRVEVEPVFR